jgi:hypothetical protein
LRVLLNELSYAAFNFVTLHTVPLPSGIKVSSFIVTAC